jgi:hypothetical protein
VRAVNPDDIDEAMYREYRFGDDLPRVYPCTRCTRPANETPRLTGEDPTLAQWRCVCGNRFETARYWLLNDDQGDD